MTSAPTPASTPCWLAGWPHTSPFARSSRSLAIAGFARENLAIAGLGGRVTLEQVALSDRRGTAELFLPPETPGRIEEALPSLRTSSRRSATW